MSATYNVLDEREHSHGIEHAVLALQSGRLVVMPTDTVYGIAAEAFNVDAVNDLFEAKKRGRHLPAPVLMGDTSALHGLATDLHPDVAALVEHMWPGALTLICWAQPTLMWDLGDTEGTVALRVPADEVARELLGKTGPLAVSSANISGEPVCTTIEAAQQQFGDAVAVYLDAGTTSTGPASTIIDCTQEHLTVVREGAMSLEALRAIVPGLKTAQDSQ